MTTKLIKRVIMRQNFKKIIIIYSILIFLISIIFIIGCSESQTGKDKDVRCDMEYILPLPAEVQDKLYNANPYNEIYSDGTRDEGIDFEFKIDPESDDITEEDLINGYMLYQVIAPCDGVVMDILHGEIIEGTLSSIFGPGYGVSIGIKYDENRLTAVALETRCYEEEDIEIQKNHILVEVGDVVKQGDLLAYFFVTNHIVPEDLVPNFSYPIIDWRVYQVTASIEDPEELIYASICPYSKCTYQAKLDLEGIFSRFYGDDYVICVP